MLGEEPGVRGGTRCYGRNQVLGEERRVRIVQETKLKVNRNQANRRAGSSPVQEKDKNAFWNQ